MPHEIWHIICGTAGDAQGEIDIKIYDGSAMNIAIAIKPDGMHALGVSTKDCQKFMDKVDKMYDDIKSELDKLGVPYQVHDPHTENFPDE